MKYFFIGSIAGLLNGLLGAGGGMILVPSFIKLMPEEKVFATSVSIMVPLSAISLIIYLINGSFDIKSALPFLIGGFIGGIISGKVKIPLIWLKRGFGILIIFSGIRNFL